MHSIEPFYNWRELYVAADDQQSPFFGTEYSEFEFNQSIYDHLIHPQWDNFGSQTLFLKVLYADYEQSFCIIEMIGEWNDTLYNDISILKRNLIDELIYSGINKFIIIGENVLNFHASDDSYYEEWFDDVEDGWIALLNFRSHVLDEFVTEGIHQYFLYGGSMEEIRWRTLLPNQLFEGVESLVENRLGFKEI